MNNTVEKKNDFVNSPEIEKRIKELEEALAVARKHREDCECTECSKTDLFKLKLGKLGRRIKGAFIQTEPSFSAVEEKVKTEKTEAETEAVEAEETKVEAAEAKEVETVAETETEEIKAEEAETKKAAEVKPDKVEPAGVITVETEDVKKPRKEERSFKVAVAKKEGKKKPKNLEIYYNKHGKILSEENIRSLRRLPLKTKAEIHKIEKFTVVLAGGLFCEVSEVPYDKSNRYSIHTQSKTFVSKQDYDAYIESCDRDSKDLICPIVEIYAVVTDEDGFMKKQQI